MDGYLTMCAKIASGANVILGREVGTPADEFTIGVLPMAASLYLRHEQQERMDKLCATLPNGQIIVAGPGCCQ